MGNRMKLIIALIMFSVLVMGCAKAPAPVACTMDAKICPDGSAVGRVGQNCEFAQCPEVDEAPITPGCTYEDSSKNYIGKTTESCSLMRFMCEEGKEPFFDDCGCGCEPISSGDGKLKAIDCTPEQREAEYCTMQYDPVCGWFDPAKIQCIKYPCSSTYSNSCAACQNPDVISWTEGECPT